MEKWILCTLFHLVTVAAHFLHVSSLGINSLDFLLDDIRAPSEGRDKAPLLNFKQSVLSDPTGALKNWNPSDPNPCSWTGVTCDAISRRVVTLDLSFRKIKANFTIGPPSLGRMRELRKLKLNGNNLFGRIPGAISKARSLQVLELGDNQLEGTLPRRFGTLKYLAILDLHGNKLTGAIKSEFAGLSSLVKLTLQGNQFVGNLPTELLSLKNLKIVRLDNNDFSGGITPFLGSIAKLETLTAAGNSLKGEIPSQLGYARQLVTLDLSGNIFLGSIPWTFGLLASLKSLSLSKNILEGNIPSRLNNIVPLTSLDLSSNRLSGDLPPLNRLVQLRVFNVSSNDLSGVVPKIGPLSKFPPSSFAENPLLCYHRCSPPPSSPPIKHPPPPKSPSPAPTLKHPPPAHSPPHPLPPSNKHPPPKSYPPPLIRGHPPRKHPVQKPPPSHPNSSPPSLIPLISPPPPYPPPFPPHSPPPPPPLIILPSKTTSFTPGVITSITLAGFIISVLLGVCCTVCCQPVMLTGKLAHTSLPEMVITFDDSDIRVADLKGATYNFSNEMMLGNGSLGATYRAEFDDDQVLAVKRLSPSALAPTAVLDIDSETRMIASLKHENIVPLLGFWTDGNEKFLIYPYMPEGNLRSLLYDQSKGKKGLRWTTRFKVALGMARGLSYLHHQCVPPVVHRDLHPNNVLLDSRLEPHLSDTGLARLVTNSSDVHVTEEGLGYMAPEYATTMVKATPKGDVFSFGVILLEMLSGKQPMDPSFADNDFIGWAKSMLQAGNTPEVLDDRIDHVDAEEEMLQILKVAMVCVAEDPDDRPSMSDVVEMLLRAKETAAKIREMPQLRDILD